ncbi:RICIN domain-containing protein [Sphaerisporangium corydalis]|uniref:RICIN domain-containing protein n=1 Tax=Sphaerisporangium corydalis TaxID=1441875 RepID=A0ABV9ENF7_9ACTN|nr:RICIN domain-containing protein [Sphaerisporangium corydalis]
MRSRRRTAFGSVAGAAMLVAGGTITNGAGGLCLDANGTANTAGVIIRTCDGRATQRWTRS